MASGFINGFAGQNNSGLALGFQMGARRGLAAGMQKYVGANDDIAKKQALSEMAAYDPNTAVQILGLERQDRITPYQQAQLDLARLKIEKAKENAVNGGFRQWLVEKAYDENEPKEKRDLWLGMAKALAHDPQLKGTETYENTVAKQLAEAGQPYQPIDNQADFQNETLENQAMVQPIQRQIPTVASLAADKKRAEEAVNLEFAPQKKLAEKTAEQQATYKKQSAELQARLPAYDKLIEEIKANKDILGKVNAINFKIGEWTDGTFGLNDDERTRYSSISRQIGDLKSNLISRAKAAGQSGINTAREIEMATAGINFDMSAASLIGAIERLKEQEQRLNDAIAAYNGGEIQPQQDVISYEEFIK